MRFGNLALTNLSAAVKHFREHNLFFLKLDAAFCKLQKKSPARNRSQKFGSVGGCAYAKSSRFIYTLKMTRNEIKQQEPLNRSRLKG